MRRHLPLLALAGALTLPLRAQNVFENPGFDQRASRWEFFVPDSSKAHGNTLVIVPDGGVNGGPAAKITLPVQSRCAIAQKNIRISGWTRYRVSFWVKADKGVEYTRGPLVRLNFRSPQADGGDTDIYVGLGGYTASDVAELKRPTWLPTDWEKVEAVVESPLNATAVSVGFFAWSVKGTIYFDEVTLEAAGPSPR